MTAGHVATRAMNCARVIERIPGTTHCHRERAKRSRQKLWLKLRQSRKLIDYFAQKSQNTHEGNSYVDAVVSILMFLDETDDIAEIKSTVRRMHREKLAEIQRTDDVATRIEQRKQLAVYDDCLTQLRGIAVNKK